MSATDWIAVGSVAAFLAVIVAIATPIISAQLKARRTARDHALKLEMSLAIKEALEPFREEMSARFDKNDADSRAAAEAAASTREKVVRIEAQFGNNGGGLREKTNKIGDTLTAVTTLLQAHITQDSTDKARIDAAILHLAEKSQP